MPLTVYRPVVDVCRHGKPSTAPPRDNWRSRHSERKSCPDGPMSNFSVHYIPPSVNPGEHHQTGQLRGITSSMSMSNLSPAAKGARKAPRGHRIGQQSGCWLARHPGGYTGGRLQDGHHRAVTGQQASLGEQKGCPHVGCHALDTVQDGQRDSARSGQPVVRRVPVDNDDGFVLPPSEFTQPDGDNFIGFIGQRVGAHD